MWTDLLGSVLILSRVGCQALGEWRGPCPPPLGLVGSACRDCPARASKVLSQD